MDAHYRLSVSYNLTSVEEDEIGVLFSGYGEPLGGHLQGPAFYDHCLLHIVLDGEGVFESGGKSHNCTAGDAFFILPQTLVRYEASVHRPWTYIWIAFTGKRLLPILDGIGISSERVVAHGCRSEELKQLVRQLRNSLDEQESDQLSSMASAGWLRLILAELGRTIRGSHPEPERREPKGGVEQVKQALLLMSLQYEKQLSIAQIAHTLGYHRAHLSKLFKQATGYSPQQYLLRIRMRKAEALLEEDLTIAQVAASVGYQDPLYFTRQFHKWCGLSPTEFRQQLGSTGSKLPHTTS